jgi:methyl-accepting chemotaxis protein
MFKNFKFKTKLLAGYGIILSLMLIIAVVVFISVKSLTTNFGWVDHTHKVLAKASRIQAAAVDMETGMRGYLLAGKEEFLEPYHNGRNTFISLTSSLSDTVADNPAQVQLLKEISKTITSWQENVTEPMIQLRREIGDSKNIAEIADLVSEAKGKAYFDKFRAQIKTFQERESTLMKVRNDELTNTEVAVINLTVLGTIIAVALGVFIAVWLTRHVMGLLGGEPSYIARIAKQVASGDLSIDFKKNETEQGIYAEMKSMVSNLQEKTHLAQQIASGNLDLSVVLTSKKDSLGIAFQEMIINLNDVLGQTQQASVEIADASGSVSSSSNALSEGASSQASSLDNISSSLNQLSTQINLNASNATQAKDLTLKAQKETNIGSNKMKEMIAAMVDISASSQSISQFINTIDEIAAQTNLLALNAAIEAARAGEQGRGFAVVADEVRNLAARSTKAAAETAQLISGAVEKTQIGSAIASQTAESLKNVTESISQASELVELIASASSEQATGANVINDGVGEIDSVTQQNNDAAQGSAAAAEQLSHQAIQLQEMLTRFKLRA